MPFATSWVTQARALRLVLGAILVLYPLLIYLGLQTLEPIFLAVMLCVLLLVRTLVLPRYTSLTWLGLVAGAAVLLLTLLADNTLGLFLYPVLVNLGLLGLFLFSYLRPPTVIERLARLREKDEFSADAIRYMRRVTLVWCLFFIFNAAMALLSMQISREFWALYTGVISYVLIGLLFAVEYLVRQRIRGREAGHAGKETSDAD